MNRRKLVVDIMQDIKSKMGQLSIFLGNCNPFIANDYVKAKQKFCNGQVPVFDLENKDRFNRMTKVMSEEVSKFLSKLDQRK